MKRWLLPVTKEFSVHLYKLDVFPPFDVHGRNEKNHVIDISFKFLERLVMNAQSYS